MDLFNTIEKIMTSEVQKVLKVVNISCTSEVNESALVKLNINPLAKIAGKMDQLKSEKITDQKLLVEIKQTQMNTV